MYIFLALVILILTISLTILSHFICINKRMSKMEKKALLLACIFSTLAAFANLFSTIMNGNAGFGIILHGLCKFIEHGFGPMTFLFLAGLVRQDKAGKVLKYLFYMNAIIQFASIWTGWCFTIDSDNVYHPGIFNSFTSVCSFLGFLYLIYAFYNFSKAYKNRNALVLLMIMVMLWISVIAHIVISEYKVTFITSMLSLILIYIYIDDFKKQIQDKEISRQMSIMDTLTLNFECVYEVDIETHYFEALRVSDFIGKQLQGKFSPTTKYEDGMEAYCSLNVYTRDREMFRKNTNLDYIIENLKDNKSYSFGYRVLRNDKTGFYNVSAYKLYEDGKPNHLLIGFADVDEQTRRWDYLMELSTTDQMTGAYNRRAYNDEIKKIDQLSASEKSLFEAIMIDVNGLKKVNDTYGHEAGDELIVSAGNILKQIYGSVGSVFRMGGDEFVIIADIHKQDSDKYLTELKNAMSEWKGIHTDKLSVSVGVARIDESEEDISIEEIIKIADARMYEDKVAYYKLHDRRNR